MTTMPIFRTNEKGTFFNQHVHEYIITRKNTKLLSILKDSNVCELRDSVGKTLLHLAAEYGNKEFVKYLINAGANVDAQDQKKQTPLMLAAALNNKGVIRLLLKAKANMFIPDVDGQCALQKVLTHRLGVNQDILVEFLRKVTVESLKNSEHVASEVFHRDCPLYHFVRLNNTEVTRILLEKGSPVDVKRPIYEETALYTAVKVFNIESIKLLLKYKADVNTKDGVGRTPLAHISPSYERGKALETVKILIAAGAILIDHDSRVNMLSQLLTHGDREMIRTLLEYEIDLLFEDKEGLTSLHYLAKNTCADVLEELPKLDFDVDIRCREGRTLLYYAAKVRNANSVKFLLDHGADVNARDHKQRTPLYAGAHPEHFDHNCRDRVAYLKDCVNCVEILLERGADPHIFAEEDEYWIELMCPNYRVSDIFLKIITPIIAKLALNEVSIGRVSDTYMRKFIDSCPRFKNTFDTIKRQLEEMKQMKIDDLMTIFEFCIVDEKKVTPLARNEKFVSNLTELVTKCVLSDAIPYYLNRRFLKIIHLAKLRKTYLPVINDVLRKFCKISIDNVAEQIIDCLYKETCSEIFEIL